MNTRSLLRAYLCQQKQLGIPSYVLDRELVDNLGLKRINVCAQKSASANSRITQDAKTTQQSAAFAIKRSVQKAVSQQKTDTTSIHSRLSSLRPLHTIVPAKVNPIEQQQAEPAETVKSRREALKDLYSSGCSLCHLAATRNKWVFGAGNAEASVMVIGEAPGVEEDAQGLPFVGAAGQLLTNMLAAIKLDRNKDLFITNVLKCRPPGNRNPESAEIQLCTPLLTRQIDIIKPRAILLLGRIAAHAVLGISESIAILRSKVHDYRGIPAMVIYHPAALLRNAQYKRPAWEDLQKFQALLENLGIYGLPK